jgi:hypothetical protein
MRPKQQKAFDVVLFAWFSGCALPAPYKALVAFVDSLIDEAVADAVADERGACAKLCDETGPDDTTGENCAEKIRART